MDPGNTFLMVSGIVLVCGLGAMVARMWFRHEERKLQIRAQNGSGPSETLSVELEALRSEVARLRDTSTQYDISIQHTLEDMQARLARVEGRQTKPVEREDAPAQKVVGLRAGLGLDNHAL